MIPHNNSRWVALHFRLGLLRFLNLIWCGKSTKTVLPTVYYWHWETQWENLSMFSVQVLSTPGCHAHVIRPLQHIMNAAAWLLLNLPTSLTLQCSSTPCTGYQWLLKSVKSLVLVCTTLRMVSNLTSRTRWNHTPQPFTALCCCQSAWFRHRKCLFAYSRGCRMTGSERCFAEAMAPRVSLIDRIHCSIHYIFIYIFF